MNKAVRSIVAILLLLTTAAALAHETQTVGEGADVYDVVVGYAVEPAYTEERNGLSLTVRSADGEPVQNLQNGLMARLTAPTGATLPLQIRAVHGLPGAYTDDFVLTEPGVYRLHLGGFIGGTEVSLDFELHEVAPLDDLRFP